MYNNYQEIILSQVHDNPTEWNFKSNIYYQEILEHVSETQGYDYLNTIINKFGTFYNTYKTDLVNMCKENDLYGKPVKFVFCNFTECSPANLRYILHSLLILEFIINKNLNNIDFIEIGGGYGGLCFFLNKISILFNISINSYTIFDLYGPCKLQEKYLKNFRHIKA